MPSDLNRKANEITVDEASSRLEVSPATLRNWVKSGMAGARINRRGLFFKTKDVADLKKKIATGEIQKLRSRANKNISEKRHTHVELLLKTENAGILMSLLKTQGRAPKKFLLALYLVQLEKAGLCRRHKGNIVFSSQKIKAEVAGWNIDFQSLSFKKMMRSLMVSELDFDDHLLNFSYQYVNSVGSKQKTGAYYTPPSLIQKTVNSVISKTGRVLDPCCGGGGFLIESMRRLKVLGVIEPWKLVYGTDSDLMAVLIARAHMTLFSCGRADSVGHIQLQNALLTEANTRPFQYILTNPPWGVKFTPTQKKNLRNQYSEVKTGESFSFFILAALQKLAPNGTLSFILPDSFLNVAQHVHVRRFLLKNYRVKEVTRCEETFSGVLTKAIAIQIENRQPSKRDSVKIVNGQTIYKKKQLELNQSVDAIISVESDEMSERLLQHIEKQGVSTLKDRADWALGIVTGDNGRFLSDRPLPKFEPVYLGRDIRRFRLDQPSQYLLFSEQKMQQVAQPKYYRCKEKLVYRFICKELVFAVDRSGAYTLNSANILIPQLHGYSIRVICGILNSSVAQFYYQKKFNTVKTLKGNLEKFPFPVPDAQLNAQINKTVARLEKRYSAEDYEWLNGLVEDLYQIDRVGRALLGAQRLSSSFNLAPRRR